MIDTIVMDDHAPMLIGQLLFNPHAQTTGGCLSLLQQLREAKSFLELRYAGLVRRQLQLQHPQQPQQQPQAAAPKPPAAKRGRKPGTGQRANGRAPSDQSLPLDHPDEPSAADPA